ncbi:hypothetical protein PR202_ga04226 [Eleusine coracana subsp. coracana]|uniref:Uncharacterized protein n=1 Tax=Eleusine coracana subsp. coracana TaxID=191504 RepID=A0AAV5BRF3_ELECO|nr:hypothetical protein PR202_ga04226 [Eleusine coracana subsp. coracana]
MAYLGNRRRQQSFLDSVPALLVRALQPAPLPRQPPPLPDARLPPRLPGHRARRPATRRRRLRYVLMHLGLLPARTSRGRGWLDPIHPLPPLRRPAVPVPCSRRRRYTRPSRGEGPHLQE